MNTPPIKPKFSRRSQSFLEEMGLGPLWVPRGAGVDSSVTTGAESSHDAADEMDVTSLSLANTPAKVPDLFADDAADLIAAADDHYAPQTIMSMAWQPLKEAVAGCVKCNLCKSRTNTVFGTGDDKADWLFIGEGPGRNEDLQGEPFIGQAGKLLDNILLELGVKRGNNAYIANVVKCRPTDQTGRDRPPTADEANACLPYLQRQIELIKPKVLVALGKTAAISLLGLDADTPVGKLRGTVHRYGDLPLIVTYHPAYLLRKLTEKGKVWSDLCLAMSVQASDAQRRPPA